MEDKTPQAIVGAIVSGTSAAASFVITHLSTLAAIVAIFAGIFSMMSAWETRQYRRAQRRKLEESDDHTTTTHKRIKMKNKIGMFLVISALCIAGISANAQDTPQTTTTTSTNIISGPGWTAFQFLTTAGVSNWMLAPYAIYDTGTKQAGAGIGAGYKINDFLVPTLRLDYLNKRVWMPSASMQLQAPVKIMNTLEFVPFAFAGIATPVSGRGDDNGEVTGIFGVGGAIRISQHFDVIGDYEKWSGFKGSQLRFGFLYKF